MRVASIFSFNFLQESESASNYSFNVAKENLVAAEGALGDGHITVAYWYQKTTKDS